MMCITALSQSRGRASVRPHPQEAVAGDTLDDEIGVAVEFEGEDEEPDSEGDEVVVRQLYTILSPMLAACRVTSDRIAT